MSEIRAHTLVVIGTDCIGSCKSNYHMIMKTKFLVCENDSDIFIGNI